MDVLVLIARILFAFLFLASGFGHFASRKAMAGYAASKGVPYAEASVIGSGVLVLAGAVMVLLGLWGDLGAVFILIFVVSTAVLMHPFWKETDEQSKMMEMVQFNKDIALAGGAIAFLVLFSFAGPTLGLTLTDPVFSIGR